jgi:hypothetical protein
MSVAHYDKAKLLNPGIAMGVNQDRNVTIEGSAGFGT